MFELQAALNHQQIIVVHFWLQGKLIFILISDDHQKPYSTEIN